MSMAGYHGHTSLVFNPMYVQCNHAREQNFFFGAKTYPTRHKTSWKQVLSIRPTKQNTYPLFLQTVCYPITKGQWVCSTRISHE